ncbi:MAG: exodeoxyribonuclease V subunit gamma [Ferrovum sp.]|nr:exodeoxyribonuclease V subunit gamma [Ferrovum sp.]
MPTPLSSGLIFLHGNRLELLRDALFTWIEQHPLDPLEEEVILVNSNGTAEWVKTALAESLGICAATRVELPARFLWRVYRQILGNHAIPTSSPLTQDVMIWRLLRLWSNAPEERSPAFLHGTDLQKRHQLAQRIADLFDQYQLYRHDWLDAWTLGQDTWLLPNGTVRPLPPDQCWQSQCWRDLVHDLEESERTLIAPAIHHRALRALQQSRQTTKTLPRRIVVFGVSTLPGVILELLVALAPHCQVLIALLNPCRYHWADTLDGRELLQNLRHHQPQKNLVDPRNLPLEFMHAHAHPLLSAWGRQGRDFMRQLDLLEERTPISANWSRIELFDEGPCNTLLEQVQTAIRDLLPLADHPKREVLHDDSSIVFHQAHTPLREVEVLHDQLLNLLAQGSIRPRDIVVMVPDPEGYTPLIQAVFNQYSVHDARHIPFEISQSRNHISRPLVWALEWLLNLPNQRITLSDLGALLNVPAIAQRLKLDKNGSTQLLHWMKDSGIRWGLDTQHRHSLNLGACGAQNTAYFGLERMILGFAQGAGASFSGIEPYTEIGGLEATLVGSLATLMDQLNFWRDQCQSDATPLVWAERARTLLQQWFSAVDERERVTIEAFEHALDDWLESCMQGRFDLPIPLSMLRHSWLQNLEEPQIGGRFLTGGVTFTSIMPLRALPFEIICLLGMNHGDYPRTPLRDDWNLLEQAGQYRPGDRSRRNDDRYLMLEILLSARRMLSISWCGQHPRDNSELPPSVLVSQLRDYLANGWRGPEGENGATMVACRTFLHPLQPFSRRYFEDGGHHNTWAREWQAAHRARSDFPAPRVPDAALPTLSLENLHTFLKNPVKTFFRSRLAVSFDDDSPLIDEEPFQLDALTLHGLIQQLVAEPRPALSAIEATLHQRLQRLRGTGQLPIGPAGEVALTELYAIARPMLSCWAQEIAHYPHPLETQALSLEFSGITLRDWVTDLRTADENPVWLRLTASRILNNVSRKGITPDKLLDSWLWLLATSAQNIPATIVLVAQDGMITLRPPASDRARDTLDKICQIWREGMIQPLPVALKTGLSWATDQSPEQATKIYEGSEYRPYGERNEPCLARLYPDFASLSGSGRFAALAMTLYGPLVEWAQYQESRPHDPMA